MTMSGSSLAQQAGSRAAPLRQRLTLLRQIMMRAKRSGLLDSGSGPATSRIRMVLSVSRSDRGSHGVIEDCQHED
jgi:hypothetical protein